MGLEPIAGLVLCIFAVIFIAVFIAVIAVFVFVIKSFRANKRRYDDTFRRL